MFLQGILLSGLATRLFSNEAAVSFAYIDPGAGSYLLQLLIAGLLGGAFVVRSAWMMVKAWIARRSSLSWVPRSRLRSYVRPAGTTTPREKVGSN